MAYSKSIGLVPVRVRELGAARHVFSHVEWDMIGYLVQVDELEKSCREEMLFIHPKRAQERYAIPRPLRSMPATWRSGSAVRDTGTNKKKTSA